MKELSENEVLAQLEEAYARATVALTRAQKLCIIMGPLDMRGLPGAATVIGCLKYGAGVCGAHDSNQAAEVFLKDSPGGGCGPPRGMSLTGRGGPARVRGDVKLRYSAGVTLKTPVPNEP